MTHSLIQFPSSLFLFELFQNFNRNIVETEPVPRLRLLSTGKLFPSTHSKLDEKTEKARTIKLAKKRSFIVSQTKKFTNVK